jgi:hypothetical protein
MLRHANFYIEGGQQTFVAVSTDDRSADKV